MFIVIAPSSGKQFPIQIWELFDAFDHYNKVLENKGQFEKINREDFDIDLLLATSGGVLASFVCLSCNFDHLKVDVRWLDSKKILSMNIWTGTTLFKIGGLEEPYKKFLDKFYKAKTEIVIDTYDRKRKTPIHVSNKPNSTYTKYTATEGEFLKTMIASTCIPFMFKPQEVVLNNRYHLLADGGVASSSGFGLLVNDRLYEHRTLKIIYVEANSIDYERDNIISEILYERYINEIAQIEFTWKSWCRVNNLTWNYMETTDPTLAMESKNFLIFVLAVVHDYGIEMTNFNATSILGVRTKISSYHYRCFYT